MTTQAPSTLALPAPDAACSSIKTLALDETIKLDEFGPMVVNSDGTLSRISNWKGMTQQEQERTMRVLGARNRIRIANEEKRLQQSGNKGTSQDDDNNNPAVV